MQSGQLGGEPALIIDGLPGRMLNRQVWALHDGQLYHLILMPFAEPALPDAQPLSATLWGVVQASWTFVD